jgi:outer membrane protein OmpA-like peptidoglycan-associated protein/tetratricopeptide (TPR) repeat protein
MRIERWRIRSIKHHHYLFAAEYYEKALKKSPKPGDIMIQIAKSYHKVNQIEESEQWFVKAQQHQGEFTNEDVFVFAQVLVMMKKKEQADILLERFLRHDADNAVVKKMLNDVRNSKKYYQDSSAFAVQSLSVNTADPEFGPAYYKDGLIFASARREGTFKKKSHWDNSPFINLYYAPKAGENFGEVALFENELNTRYHDGPAVFYAGQTRMILNRNQRFKVEGREKVYEWRPGLYDVVFDSAKSSWVASPLPFNNAEFSYLHPSISEDGNILYFASDMPGGYGGTDLYKVVRSHGVWGNLINLGASVNTQEDEAFPFMIDNTLYFTSNGHGGLGGLDIYKSEILPQGFTEPVNLGYPINTTADDFSLITDPGQRNGYFASSRNGNDDLFSFQKLSNNQVLAMGIVKNSQEEIVEGYKATVTNRNTGAKVSVQKDRGGMSFLAERGQTYDITVEHDNYQTAQQDLNIPLRGPETEKFTVILRNKEDLTAKLLVVDTDKGTSKAYVKNGETLNEITEKDNQLFIQTPAGSEYLAKGNLANIRRDPSPVLKELGLKKSDRTNLRNIYFDFDKANLDKEDEAYLKEVANILVHDPSLKLLVAGHADDRGSEAYNIKLSRRRVQVVSKFLISRGIKKDRIIEKAYGESLPVVPCFSGDCSEDDHQKNRRAEFVMKHDNAEAMAPISSKPTRQVDRRN